MTTRRASTRATGFARVEQAGHAAPIVNVTDMPTVQWVVERIPIH